MNRAERRRRERAHSKGRQPVLIAGANLVASELDHRYEARPHAELPEKVAGQHRWIAAAVHVLNQEQIRAANDPDKMKLLDHENLMELGIICWDCERPLGAVDVDSECSGEAAQ